MEREKDRERKEEQTSEGVVLGGLGYQQLVSVTEREKGGEEKAARGHIHRVTTKGALVQLVHVLTIITREETGSGFSFNSFIC